jgi:hypothetical protein
VGGVLNSPAQTVTTLIGNVVNVNLITGAYTFAPPALGPGTYLLSMAGPLIGTFAQITGGNPVAGDSVKTLDAATQIYTTSTFNGTTWDDGAPSLNVDEAAYFTIVVPEPSTFALVSVAAGILLICKSNGAICQSTHG